MMMKGWKKKLHRGQKEGYNDAKKRLHFATDVHQRRSATSPINVNLTSCLKKPDDYDTDGSISVDRKSESVSESVSEGVSTGSSTVDSMAGRTASTSGCSSRMKKVRFDVVEIREYERAASDNPCCSSGPPIGIGWNHGETHRINMNDYEQNRGERTFYLDTVLTRSEREVLLLEWDVNRSTIVASTRAAMKTKFQRKQTVVNARKFSKLEEVVEVTSRRLKRALLPRRRTDDGAEELPELTASNAFERDNSRAGDTISTSTLDEDKNLPIQVTELDDDDIIEKLMTNTFDMPTVGIGNETDDNISINDEITLGATTLGDTSAYSPSVIAMENFYRELELELFGEENDLPSMVGQTLEVPLDAERNITTSNYGSDRVQDDISFAGTFDSNPQSAYHEKYRLGPVPDESRSGPYGYSAVCDTTQESIYDVPTTSTRNIIYQHHPRENYDHPPFTQGALPPEAGWTQTHSLVPNPHRQSNGLFDPVSRYPTTQNDDKFVPQSEFDPQYTQYPRGNYEPMHSQRNNYRHRRNGSFDSSYNTTTQNQILYPSSERGMQQYAQSQFQPSNLPSSLNDADFAFRHSYPSGHHHAQRHSQSNFDGPQVRHTPLRGHLSANQWIEGIDGPRPFYNDATITITEGNS